MDCYCQKVTKLTKKFANLKLKTKEWDHTTSQHKQAHSDRHMHTEAGKAVCKTGTDDGKECV